VHRAIVVALLATSCLARNHRVERRGGDEDGGTSLVLAPPRVVDHWLDVGDGPVEYTVTVTRPNNADFRVDELTTELAWLETSWLTEGSRSAHILRLIVDPTQFFAAIETASVAIISGDEQGTLELEMRALGPPRVHVGPTSDGCRRAGATACDYSGTGGLYDATRAIGPGTRIILYAGATQTFYDGPVSLPANTWLGPPRDIGPTQVVIRCDNPGGTPSGTIELAGDNSRIHGITVAVGSDCGHVFSAYPGRVAADATGGHLIERILGFAYAPPVWGSNGIEEPFRLGPDSTLRNSRFFGYFQTFDFAEAHRSRVLNNTFVIFESRGGLDVSGVAGLTVANNIFLLTRGGIDTPIFSGSPETVGLTLTGNVAEHEAGWAEGLDHPSNIVQADGRGVLNLESPLTPLFLSDAQVPAELTVAAEGTSLDGVAIDGMTTVLPGASQARSANRTPRRTVVRVGEDDCDGTPCNIHKDIIEEIQAAVWSAWPGSTIEIYPSSTAYAGNAVIPWTLTIRGMGAEGDVVLADGRESQALQDAGHWSHGSILAVLGFATATCSSSRAASRSSLTATTATSPPAPSPSTAASFLSVST